MISNALSAASAGAPRAVPDPAARRPATDDPDLWLKRGVWAYFLLLIFEGALRKWFLPGLSTPLLVVRDPLALWLILATWRRGQLPANLYLTGMVLVGIIGFFTAVFLGHGNPAVALFGARILLLHFPMVFVIGRLFDRAEVLRLGRVMLWLTIPMTVLIALQFFSPQSAWVNRGVGGDMAGAGFSGTADYFRPPGTFSFTNGNTLFYSFAAPFIFYFLLNPKQANRLLVLGATGALLLAIPLSISRGLFFSVGVTLIFALIAILRKPGYFGRVVLAGVAAVVLLAVLSRLSFFQTATGAFTERFENANETEGGLQGVLVERYLVKTLGSVLGFSAQVQLPFFGYGLGVFTNVGQALTGFSAGLDVEAEWSRLIAELGPILGLSVVGLRIGLSWRIARACYQQLVRGELLPWMLLSFGLLIIPQGLWSQPTSLGFFVVTAGLSIAALRAPTPTGATQFAN